MTRDAGSGVAAPGAGSRTARLPQPHGLQAEQQPELDNPCLPRELRPVDTSHVDSAAFFPPTGFPFSAAANYGEIGSSASPADSLFRWYIPEQYPTSDFARRLAASADRAEIASEPLLAAAFTSGEAIQRPSAANESLLWESSDFSATPQSRSAYAAQPHQAEVVPGGRAPAFGANELITSTLESNLGAEPLPAPGVSPAQAVADSNTKGLKKFPGIYSATSFDIIGLLGKIATRPNPRIQIGPVDLTCSFLVVDPQKYDMPIIYASPTFVKLTGYSEEETVGQNCRFLQAPDGHVAVGSCRRYTDNVSVRHMKSCVFQGKECQTSIINYRKGGQPFVNLVTIIPIFGDRNEVSLFVGLQVDLVEQPKAIIKRMRNSTYNVNYALGQLPQYIQPATPDSALVEYMRETASEALPFPATSEILAMMGGPTSTAEDAKSVWSRMLLQNSPDFIHVLSVHGTFLYCSPAVGRLLEYKPEDLVGQNFSTICHPLDAVQVMRDIKHASTSAGQETVELVYRVRRKLSGYVWLEAVGTLSVYSRRRKCFVMSARPRPVYNLPRRFLQAIDRSMISAPEWIYSSSDIPTSPLASGAADLWAKLSMDGLYLFATSTSQQLLGIPADELVGTSLYQYALPDKTADMTYALLRVRHGVIVTLRHSFRSRRGTYIDVVTTFWPGDGINSDPVQAASSTAATASDFVSASCSTRPCSSSTSLFPLAPAAPGAPSSSGNAATGQAGDPIPARLRKWETSFILCQTRKLTAADSVELMVEKNPAEFPPCPDANEDKLCGLLDCVRTTSWQFGLHELRLANKKLREQIEVLQQASKEERRQTLATRKVCAECHRKNSPEWRTGPEGRGSLCNACGLRYAKLMQQNVASGQSGEEPP